MMQTLLLLVFQVAHCQATLEILRSGAIAGWAIAALAFIASIRRRP
jgi:presenilin-like A22 family membrane protease